MNDSFNSDRTGWARFSDDMRMRYRLARALTPRAIGVVDFPDPAITSRVVFVMLNPSTADAFKLDPTVRRCAEWARRWGADVLEVVNLFALRSPYPADLKIAARDRQPIGDDVKANQEILAACSGAHRVIAAWGRHGALFDRGTKVRGMLRTAGVELRALQLTDDGVPKHPLARGKAFIPYEIEPVALP